MSDCKMTAWSRKGVQPWLYHFKCFFVCGKQLWKSGRKSSLTIIWCSLLCSEGHLDFFFALYMHLSFTYRTMLFCLSVWKSTGMITLSAVRSIFKFTLLPWLNKTTSKLLIPLDTVVKDHADQNPDLHLALLFCLGNFFFS